MARQGNDIAVEIASDGMTSRVTGSHLLLAIGRRPNTDDLGLEAAGIPVDERGFIKVDDQLRTERARGLGPGRLQRPGRLHAHVVQRL